MNVLRYIVSHEELRKSNKWVSKVLQSKFGKVDHNDKLFVDITSYAYRLLKARLSEEELNTMLYNRVEELQKMFPERFPAKGTLGWYEKTRLAELFLEGRVILDGLRYEEILARQEVENNIKKEALLAKNREEEERVRLKEEERVAKVAEAEGRRKEVVAGMLFRRKDGLIRAFIEAYPKGIAVSRVAKDLPKLVEVEWVSCVDNGIKRKVWEVKEVTGGMGVGRAWEEDLVKGTTSL